MSEEIPISDVVKTRELYIYDDQDRLRIALSTTGGLEPKISLYKEDGTPAIEISSMEIDKDSRRIWLYGKGHKWRLMITSNDNGVGADAFDENGKHIGAFGMIKNEESGEYEAI